MTQKNNRAHSKIEQIILKLSEFFESTPTLQEIQTGCIHVDGREICLQEINVQGASRLVFSSLIDTIEADIQAEVFELVLSANYHWRGTQGGTIGYNPASNTLSYCLQPQITDPWSLDIDAICELLHQIFVQVEFWSDRVRNIRDGQVEANLNSQFYSHLAYADHQKFIQ